MYKYSTDNDYGVYRASVASNQDPLKMGRVKVRVPCYHGTHENGIPDSDLPWAIVCMQGASYQSGMYIVPEVGSQVLVVFENGSHSKPVAIGGIYSCGSPIVRYMSESPSTYLGDPNYFKEDSEIGYVFEGGKRMVPAFQPDVPSEALDDTSTKVVYKSPKGAHILIKDKDGEETFEIRDSNGQILRFESPMASHMTGDNKHKWTDYAENLIGKAKMLISNGLGLVFSFVSDGKRNKASLADSLLKMGVEIDGENKKCRLFNHSGTKVEVSLENGKVSVQSSGAYVEVDEDSVEVKGARVVLEAPKVEINGSSINLSGDVKINGSLRADGSVVAGGVDLSGHYHSTDEGQSSSPLGSGGTQSGPEYEAPTREISEWVQEE